MIEVSIIGGLFLINLSVCARNNWARCKYGCNYLSFRFHRYVETTLEEL